MSLAVIINFRMNYFFDLYLFSGMLDKNASLVVKYFSKSVLNGKSNDRFLYREPGPPAVSPGMEIL